MSVTRCEVRRGAYYDSVVLMQLQRSLSELPGVQDAGVVMATEANLNLLEESRLLVPEAKQAGPDDLLLAVRADDATRAEEVLAQVDSLLKQRRSSSSQSFQPRSLASAAKALPEANWVLVSVPGRYAAGVAREALEADKNVFLYSDNVPLADEVTLKRLAREKGLLMMGPDCGTAIINGVGLGFANRARRGVVGLVAASGTGLQAIVSHIQRLGAGVSQAIGTGGRDLAEEVGGATTMQALEVLAEDPDTEVIVLVSKPPAAEVAARVLGRARATGKPVVVYFMGQPVTARQMGNLYFAFNLLDAAELAAGLRQDTAAPGTDVKRFAQLNGRYVRGLFSGGTLAYEMVLGLQSLVSPLFSNVPLRDDQRLGSPLRSEAHTILDMGADDFTQGRLHPMMDNTLRIRRMHQEAADPEVGLIIVDVVLGEGSHPDPSEEMVPAIAQIKADHAVDVAALLVGTEDDPQDLARQREVLAEAGARIFESTVGLAGAIAESIEPAPGFVDGKQVPAGLFARPLAAINVGLESFYDSLKGQGAEAIHVAWRPPAGGNEKMMALLAKLKTS